jgi:hypothetical protein
VGGKEGARKEGRNKRRKESNEGRKAGREGKRERGELKV